MSSLRCFVLTLFFASHFIDAKCELQGDHFLNESNKSQIVEKKYRRLKSQMASFVSNSWCSVEKSNLLMDFIVTQKPKVCVEIGVFQGASFIPAAVTLKYLDHGVIYGIDPWSNAEAIKHMSSTDPNKWWWGEVNLNSIYDGFLSTISKWKVDSKSRIFRMTSEEAVKVIGDIDFLHLDGNYSRVSSMQDVMLYAPKVRVGGYILFSNVFVCIDNEFPKKASFLKLIDWCEVVTEIEEGNTVLLRKVR